MTYKESRKFAIGTTKVLMMPQIKEILDKSNDKAAEKFNASAKVIKKAFMCFSAALVAKKHI